MFGCFVRCDVELFVMLRTSCCCRIVYSCCDVSCGALLYCFVYGLCTLCCVVSLFVFNLCCVLFRVYVGVLLPCRIVYCCCVTRRFLWGVVVWYQCFVLCIVLLYRFVQRCCRFAWSIMVWSCKCYVM